MQRTSPRRRLQRSLAGGPNRRPPGLHPSLGGAASLSPFLNRRLAFSILFSILALLAASLLFLLPGSLLRAQEGGTIEYPERETYPVATYTASDPEGASVRWSLDGVDAGDFTIDNGVLRFAKTPDYESPKGSGTTGTLTNTYVVDVQATDETRRMESETVTVEVTNVDEAGKVTLSARRPQTDTEFTAGITDPDRGVVDVKWQWAKAGSKNGTYRDIDDATSEDYTPEDADAGSYLRATATYEDDEGEGKTAMMVSEFPSQRITGGNEAPEFAAVQDPDGADDAAKAIAKRSVAENTDSGKTVGSPVVATDDNNDTLTYTLTDDDGGTDGDSASFGIDWGTGQILTKGDLDHEVNETYTVVVRATDPAGVPSVETAQTANSNTVTVTITVTDVNDAPVVAAAGDSTATPTFAELLGDITTALGTYEATDQDEDAPERTWSLGGADGSKFDIAQADGGLTFKKKPDYEKPIDADMDNVYEVTVQASDGRLTGMLKVKVTVNNENEEGTVTLDKVTPVVGIPVTASLKDADGGISKLTWQWSINGATAGGVTGVTATSNGDIDDATSDTYKPKAGDVGGTLTATASYFDGESAADADMKKTANEGADNPVALDTRNKAPVFGDEDPDTSGVQNSAATRSVEEKTTDNVGDVVNASDTKADGSDERLQYRLTGTDAGKFEVLNDDLDTTGVDEGGQITVGSATKLDYEGKRTYMVTVTATDPLGASSSIPVTIEVTNVDEAPDISGDDTIEYPERETYPVATYTASDPEGASVRWSLDGVDAGDFTIENGVLRFAKTPDYESPKGSGTTGTLTNTYVVNVQATDETRRMESETVTVEVTNVEEAGKVTLSARRPQSDTEFTAGITDPDRGVVDVKWQWAKVGSKNGTYRDIDDATSEDYTPEDADAGSYLRATATYEDDEGEGKTAMMVSEFPSQLITGGNEAPEFAAVQDPDGADDAAKAIAKRSVAENTDSGKTVGSPVVATDDNNDTLTYTLTDDDGGTDGDSASFGIDWGTGQILTKGDLDHEVNETYTVVVRATDPAGVPQAATCITDTSANGYEPICNTVTVTITVTDVNDAPVVVAAGDSTATPTFAELLGDITTALGTYEETDQDEDAPERTWSLGGADGSKFDIAQADGGLTFKKKPDYEKPIDADMDNVYEVTVQASDGKLTGMLKVKVTVNNENEEGTVTLDKVTPVVGIPVTASLEDADGGISKLTWQWVESDGSNTVSTSDTYTPKAGDVGHTLTVTASYFDGQNALTDTTKKTAGVTSVAVERDTRNKAPVFGDEDPDTTGVQNSAATRKVEENTTDNVGAPVAASDTKADGSDEALQYRLSGADMPSFSVDNSGQIAVGSGTKLDYEGKRTYMVTVTATDPLGASSSIPVTIEVTNVDEAPEIMRAPDANVAPEFADSEDGARSVAENTVAGEDIGNPVAASDANGDALTYALSGTDTASFAIDPDTGQLMTLASLNYETKATYSVTVTASDSGGLSGSIDVTITVTDVDDEMGTGDPLADGYDANDSGTIDRTEVGQAVRDFIGRRIEHDDVVKVIAQYFKDLRSGS